MWDIQGTDVGIILGVGSANERKCNYVTPSLIGWAHTQNDPSWWAIAPIMMQAYDHKAPT